jgi:DNA G:T-mismatch repair endonuclease
MRKLTTEQFIEKAKEIHGDKYDYSEVNYVNYLTKVKIICQNHGEFLQTPYNHLNGSNCPKCARINTINKQSSTTEQFIEKAKEIHGDKYDYSEVNYVNNHSKVKIICQKHGSFWQSPNNHISQCQGCFECGKMLQIEKRSLTTEQFIEKAKEIHGDKYDYSEVNYINNHSKVKIICQKHGSFWQVASWHLQSRGCPSCSHTFSRPEEEFRQFIQSLIPSAYKTKLGEIIPKQELDVYLPSRKIAFEFQGEYWHKHHHVDAEERDERKRQSCQKLGIKLYEIWENDWNNHKEEIKTHIDDIIQWQKHQEQY